MIFHLSIPDDKFDFLTVSKLLVRIKYIHMTTIMLIILQDAKYVGLCSISLDLNITNELESRIRNLE